MLDGGRVLLVVFPVLFYVASLVLFPVLCIVMFLILSPVVSLVFIPILSLSHPVSRPVEHSIASCFFLCLIPNAIPPSLSTTFSKAAPPHVYQGVAGSDVTAMTISSSADSNLGKRRACLAHLLSSLPPPIIACTTKISCLPPHPLLLVAALALSCPTNM